jgi:PAS domain S-box-containing protein
VISPVAKHPSPESLKLLDHEYSLREKLDARWTARPLAIARHWDRTVLVLEDPGGVPLIQLLGHPLNSAFSLRLGINLAIAISQLHQRGIIHKNIKPRNILVNSATGQAWLTGFGIASRLPRERQFPKPPEFIAGTLAYMAPEQTGRMNRSVDSRSDLYSLGVTLYEMLTGALPFDATDPMEWVHCHVARQAPPITERVERIPEAISAIVSKLLAKHAEERYQTAAGLEADLRKCLAEWESLGRIEPFQLGTCDTPDRLLIPEKLYGRDAEREVLLGAFDRVVASGNPELVVLSGYSGIGKSSVVNELQKAIVLPRGIFISGKFDQHKRNIPYATLAQALQGYVSQILSKSEGEVGHWREAILEAVGKNGQLMVNLIPDLELVIGKQLPVSETPPQDAQNRFQLVFRRFLGAFARPEHPLALFLDDLQWLDTATLELLELLLTEPEVRNLLLVGAYRDNEVSPSHPLIRTLDAIRKAGASVQEIVLMPLRLDDVVRLVADTLQCGQDSARPLAELIHEKTGGNPFFAIQFITALTEEALLTFDHRLGRWSWNLTRIQAKAYTDNVVDLMVGKLHRLAGETQQALQLLACLGDVAEIATLRIARGTSEPELHADLWEAVRQELIMRSEGTYKFVHDRVQEAAYSLLPEALRGEAHLRIGRFLLSRTQPQEIEGKIFEIVNQFNRGSELINSLEERERIAELNLIAGKRAKTSAAYASALRYFVAGRGLLPKDSWKQRYALTFALEFQRAECEFLTGDFVAAEKRLSVLSRRAVDVVDSASVARLRAELYIAWDRVDRAVEVGLEYLRGVGVDWSPHPTDDQVRQEYERIWQQLGNRPIEALIDLPPMTDPACRATLDVLTALEGVPARFAGMNLQCLVVARMANLSLQHGNGDGSCVAYVHLGWFVGPRFADHQAAFRFGKLALDLVEKRGLERFRARVSQIFGYFLNPWSRHLRAGLGLLRRSFTTALEAGDLQYAAFSYDRLVTFLLAAGEPLGDVQREAENGFEFTRTTKFAYVTDIIIGQLRFIRTLRGLTPILSSFNDGEFDEGQFEQHLEADPHLVFATCWYWIRKLQARFYAGDYAAALVAASKAEPLLQTGAGHFESAEYVFYEALARAAQCDFASSGERSQDLEALAAHYKQIDAWAQNCPENFGTRAALVGAEVARIEGRELDAQRLYEQAIHSAGENGFVQNEGVANELAARFYASRGFETIAQTYLRNARYCYLRWGADGKVRQLDELYPYLRGELSPPGHSATIAAPVEHLDVAAIIKVSQATSGEIVPDKLINTLMRTALEQAGAERSLLILSRGVEHRIEAEARIDRDKTVIHFRQSLITPSELPESVLRYVIRTQQSVILNDASAENIFSEDEYIRRKCPRSMLCLPLVKQRQLTGVLYFENNLAPGVFTPNRLAMLELIASQAAISLEQARLYAELADANKELNSEIEERRRAEGALRQSEAYLSEAQRISRTGSFGWDVSSGYLYWSQETFRIFEYDPSTGPTYHRVLQRTHPEDREVVRRVVDRAVHERKDFDFEYRLLMPDRSVKYLRVVGRHSTEFQLGNFVLVGTVTDITERRRAEEALRQSEAYLSEAQRLSRIGSFGWDLSSGNLYWTQEMFRIFEYDPSTKPTLELVFQRTHPEDRELVRRVIDRTVHERQDFDVEHRLLMLDGSVKYLWVVGRYSTEFQLGNFVFVGTVTDITERVRAEETVRKTHEQLAHATRVTALGELAASVAHEVNQPLTAIINNANACLALLPTGVDELDEVCQALAEIANDADRAGAVLARIRGLVKKSPLEKARLHLRDVVSAVLALVRPEAVARRVTVQAQIPEDLPLTFGDRVQLQQVLLNLVMNGMDAMNRVEEQKRLLVISGRRDAYDGWPAVTISVQDFGIGLKTEEMERLFDAFYTTKPEGMGMGLAISRSIVEEHGGRLWTEPNQGPGATFLFSLPAADRAHHD